MRFERELGPRRYFSGKELVETALNVSPAVQDPNDPNRRGVRAIDDQIGKDRPKLDRGVGQVSAGVAGGRMPAYKTDPFPNLPHRIPGYASTALLEKIRLD